MSLVLRQQRPLTVMFHVFEGMVRNFDGVLPDFTKALERSWYLDAWMSRVRSIFSTAARK